MNRHLSKMAGHNFELQIVFYSSLGLSYEAYNEIVASIKIPKQVRTFM